MNAVHEYRFMAMLIPFAQRIYRILSISLLFFNLRSSLPTRKSIFLSHVSAKFPHKEAMFTRHVVDFYTVRIKTLVTDEPLLVIWWIYHVSSLHRMRLHKLIVGLDVNCCSSSDLVATLQRCVDHNCLLFQLLQAHTVLDSLRAFLRDFNNTFVGIGIRSSSFALDRDHGLGILRTINLRELAAAGFGNTLLRGMGPARLVRRVLDREYVKPVVILWRRWDAGSLPLDMVCYACIDAYVCFEMGREMGAHRVMA